MHAMIDLETLDTCPEAVVLSVGVSLFDPNDTAKPPIEGYYAVLDVGAQTDAGRTTSQSTLDWWSKQSPESRTVLTAVKKPVVGVLKALTKKIDWASVEGVWGNGPSFDNAMMKSLYGQWGMELPWAYWLDRDHRTIKALYEKRYGKLSFPRAGTHHNALDDAMHQARELQYMVHQLGVQL